MLRPIRSVTFEIQTVGRILRMPEAKHYEQNILNQAFVYTNLPEIIINNNPEDLEFFKTQQTAFLKNGIENVRLPSVHFRRTDYGDLTQRFETVLVEVLNERFGITEHR
jgi:type III restriction enzyme